MKTLQEINKFNLGKVPQTEQAHPDQIQNAAGGYVFQSPDLQRLRRFLILGTEGGTFYVNENKLSRDNANVVFRLATTKHRELVDTIVDVSVKGAAYRQDPTLFALAIAASVGTDDEKRYALSKLPEVARTGTMIFQFSEYVQQFRGWGRGLRRGIAAWYLDKDVDKLAYQAVKYRQRNGWTHRDLLRLSHPVTEDPARKDLFEWITTGEARAQVPQVVLAFEQAKEANSVKEILLLMEKEPSLSWEMIPTQFLKDPEIWKALVLKGLPMTALIRQLSRLSSLEMMKGEVKKKVLEQLADAEYLRKSRIHPMQVLVAGGTYESGYSQKGNSSWSADKNVVRALDKAFYKTFDNVEPTGKRILVAIDVSGSMHWAEMAPGITPAVGSAALAKIFTETEAVVDTVAFSMEEVGVRGGGISAVTPFKFKKGGTLDQAMAQLYAIPMGGTDCSLPFKYAYDNNLVYDAVVVLTDNETWGGYVHPYQAAEAYREKVGLPVKFVVVGMTSTDSDITNPDDPNSLAVVGFDPGMMTAISSFIKGD